MAVEKKGTIKWFSLRKKYGFVVDEENNEYFFHADKIKRGTDAPGLKDIVSFEVFESKKGLRAKNLKVLVKGETEKFRCPSCKEEIVPKIIEKKRDRTYLFTEIKKSSVCPNCNFELEEHVDNEQEKISLLFRVMFLIILILTVAFFILN